MRYSYVQQQAKNNSRPTRTRTTINRNREDKHSCLMNDYFSENGVCTKTQFRRSNRYPYFQLRYDASGRKELSPLQKSPANSVDEYVKISKSTTVECLEAFVKGVNEIFEYECLRRPNNNNINRLLQIGKAHEFSGMLLHDNVNIVELIYHRKSTVILEVVASQDLVVGSNNDINVLNQSSVFIEFLQGRAPLVQFTINGISYNMEYYLADDIYPD
ncbi:hypothetical protein GmHk_01G001967 [Glycine max]|nr:hypothetical protein GmHk_01G001967 [Glycine max]